MYHKLISGFYINDLLCRIITFVKFMGDNNECTEIINATLEILKACFKE